MTARSADESLAPREGTASKGPGRLLARLVLVTLLMAELLIQVDLTIVNVALPSIQHDLGFTDSGLPWVVNSYALLYGGLILLGGRIGDVFGQRRVLITGITVFVLASLICGLSPNPTVMVIGRSLQGVGGALTVPVVLSLIISLFEEGPKRQKALALWGSAAAAGSLLGLLIGGLLTSGPGWPYSFFLSIPIGIAIVVLSFITIPGGRSGKRPSLDVIGAVMITAVLLLIAFVFLDIENSWISPQRGGLLLVAAVLFVAFLVFERRRTEAVIPLHIFRSRNTSGALGIMLMFGATQMSYFYFVTLYLQNLLGFSALQTGIAYLPLIGILLVSAQVGTKVVERIGLTWLLVIGLSCLGLGMAWLGVSAPSLTFVGAVLGPTVLSGIGLGLTMMPASSIATTGVAPDDAGAVSGLFNTAMLIGGSLGLAVLTAVTQAAGGLANVHGFRVGFLTCAAIMLIALAVTALVIRMPRRVDVT